MILYSGGLEGQENGSYKEIITTFVAQNIKIKYCDLLTCSY